MKDVRYSVSETLIRSIEAKKLQIHKKFPKSESLKDCMDRTIPYFIQQIEKEVKTNAVQNNNVYSYAVS
jgi:bisphosphoglycerate-dependent phosphoglycerate mutase